MDKTWTKKNLDIKMDKMHENKNWTKQKIGQKIGQNAQK